MNCKKYLLKFLLLLIVALMVVPFASAEDSLFLASTDNGAQPPELPSEFLSTGNNEPPEIFLTSNSPDNSSSQNYLLGDSNQNSVISGSNLTKVYGDSDRFEVTLKDSNGNPIIGQHVYINLTRISSGANKVYDSVTDFTGLATLEINLAPGFYTAQSNFYNVEGFSYSDASTFNTITVRSVEDSRIPTVIFAEPATILYGAGEYYNVFLSNDSISPIIGQHVSLTLSRPSNGASKTYDSVTDFTGLASLQINLAPGTYNIRADFGGQGNYGPSTATSIITVVESRPVTPNGTDGDFTPVDNGTVPGEGNSTIPPVPGEGNSTIPPVPGDGNFTPVDNGTVPGEGNSTIPPAPPVPIVPVNPLENETEVSNNTNATEGSLIVNGEILTLDNAVRIFSSLEGNKNSVLVGNGGVLNLIRATIVKMGVISDADLVNANLFGSNSAVLVLPNSVLNLNSGTLISTSDGAHGIFSTNLDSSNTGSTISVDNSRIDTHLNSASGLMATFGGFIRGDNLVVNTRGVDSSAVKTGVGDGFIFVSNSELNTGILAAREGYASPLIYSMGDIIVVNSTGTAYQSQIAYLEGRSSLVLDNVSLTGYGKGNIKSNGVYGDLAGFFLYHSGSSNVDTGVAVLNITNSDFTIPEDSSYYTTAPMFHVTNTEALINIDNCNLKFGSNTLLEVNSQTLWGRIGSNGGIATLNANNQVLNGNILVDSLSTLNLNLKSSTYTGSINPTYNSGNTAVSIDSSSAWTLTGDSYISSLNNQGSINYNGHTLYVNGVAYNSAYPFI